MIFFIDIMKTMGPIKMNIFIVDSKRKNCSILIYGLQFVMDDIWDQKYMRKIGIRSSIWVFTNIFLRNISIEFLPMIRDCFITRRMENQLIIRDKPKLNSFFENHLMRTHGPIDWPEVSSDLNHSIFPG